MKFESETRSPLQLLIQQCREKSQRTYLERIQPLVAALPQIIGSIGIDDAEGLTVALSQHGPLGKTYTHQPDGTFLKTSTAANAFQWSFYPIVVRDFETLAETLVVLNDMPAACLLRAGLHSKTNVHNGLKRQWHATDRHDGKPGGALVDVARRWLVIDIDTVALPDGVTYDDMTVLIDWVCGRWMPLPFKGATCVWQASASAGLKTSHGTGSGDRLVKLHLFYRGYQPIGCRDYHRILQRLDGIDPAIGVGPQIIYTSKPTLIGGTDPLEGRRVGIFKGDRDLVVVDPLPQPTIAPHRQRGAQQGRAQLTIAPHRQRGAQQGQNPTVSHHIDRPEVVRNYNPQWAAILNTMGYGFDGCEGYNKPIFKMVGAAIRAGETDFELLKRKLRNVVPAVMRQRGDVATKQADIERYLSDAYLNAEITNSINYWFNKETV